MSVTRTARSPKSSHPMRPTHVGNPFRPTVVVLTCLSLMCPNHVAAARPFEWPLLPRPTVVVPYDPPAERWLPGHRGVDLQSSDPARSALSAGDGIVTFAGQVAGRPVVSVTHENGLRSTYEPVVASVSVGDRVRSGQRIGIVEPGHPGCPVAWCLHWGMRRGREYVDPTLAVELGRLRLVPIVEEGQRVR